MKTAVTVSLSLALLSFVAPASAAPGDELVKVRDATSDVRLTNAAGPNAAVRRTIDLRRVRIIERRARIRFEVKITRVLGPRDFDQMIFVKIRPAASSGATWSSDLGFSAQQPDLAYAGYAEGEEFVGCDPLRSKRLSAQVVALDVPRRCLPEGPAAVVVTSLTGIFRSDAPVWSKDRVRVPGLVRVR